MNRFSYHIYEMAHLALAPARAWSDVTKATFRNPLNPWTHTHVGRNLAASAELFERLTRRYGKPAFSLDQITVDGVVHDVVERVVWQKPYCRLIHFEKVGLQTKDQPRLLIVAPMSGHYATLLRGTVEALLPNCDIYITDWTDSRMVPLSVGTFGFDDYVEYLMEMFAHLNAGGQARVHSMGVCQPSVPLLSAIALMEENGDRFCPQSMILIGGPIDTRRSPTAVNTLAQERGTAWFRRNCIVTVPFPYPGMGREVYPGFLQLSGFMAMNLDRHMNAHFEMFNHLVEGDGDSAEKHREFYDEYLAVMDLDAAYYLETIDRVFVRHLLPRNELTYRGRRVETGAIRATALMTIEGEKDDISGVGQTAAAHDLCCNLPEERKVHHLQMGVGHYGVFNGSRFRKDIAPRMVEFLRTFSERT